MREHSNDTHSTREHSSDTDSTFFLLCSFFVFFVFTPQSSSLLQLLDLLLSSS